MNLPGIQIEQLLNNLLTPGDGIGLKANGCDQFSGTLKNMLKSADLQGQPIEQGMNLQSLSGLKGKKFLAGLKKLLLENGLNPKNLEANDTALAAFEHLLASAGFDPKQVENFMQTLKTGSEKKGISLSDMFKGAADLDEQRDSDPLLDASAVPYIESILSQLLPNPADRQMAWEGVRREGNGIDLSRLVQNLSEIAQNLPDKGRGQPSDTVQQQLENLIKAMGMSSETGVVTLEKFVAKLQAAVSAQETATGLGGSVAASDLSRMMANIKPVKDPRNESGNPDGNGKIKVASINGEKLGNPLNGKHTAAAEPVKAEANEQMPKNILQNLEAPMDETKPMSTAGSDASKVVELSARSTVEGAKLPVRTLPAYVVNQVSRQMVRSYQNGANEIRLQLNPPNLGRLQMNIDNSGEMLRVQIVAEQQSTQELLLSHAGDLKSVLGEQGLRVEKIDVQFDQFFDQSLSNARQESGRSNHRRRRGQDGSVNDAETPDDNPDEKPPSTESVLDLVA